MKITNKFGYPRTLVDACRLDTYDRGESDITVTQLIGPPQIRRLREKHENDIEVDVSELTWAMRGKAKHYVLELASKADDRIIVEKRFYANFDTAELGATFHKPLIRLGGQIDLYDQATLGLWDYKETSVWTYVYQSRTVEWTEQLNVLRYLLLLNGLNVTSLAVCAFWRDWNARRSSEGGGYPEHDVTVIDIPIWGLEETEDFVANKLKEHFSEPPRPCTDEERWLQPMEYAVMKPRAKRAMRNFQSYADAKAFMERQTMRGLRIEKRGEEDDYRRCQQYCDVSKWCPQFNHHQAAAEQTSG